MRICPIVDFETKCTENCRDCAKELRDELAETLGPNGLAKTSRLEEIIGRGGIDLLIRYNYLTRQNDYYKIEGEYS